MTKEDATKLVDDMVEKYKQLLDKEVSLALEKADSRMYPDCVDILDSYASGLKFPSFYALDMYGHIREIKNADYDYMINIVKSREKVLHEYWQSAHNVIKLRAKKYCRDNMVSSVGDTKLDDEIFDIIYNYSDWYADSLTDLSETFIEIDEMIDKVLTIQLKDKER